MMADGIRYMRSGENTACLTPADIKLAEIAALVDRIKTETDGGRYTSSASEDGKLPAEVKIAFDRMAELWDELAVLAERSSLAPRSYSATIPRSWDTHSEPSDLSDAEEPNFSTAKRCPEAQVDSDECDDTSCPPPPVTPPSVTISHAPVPSGALHSHIRPESEDLREVSLDADARQCDLHPESLAYRVASHPGGAISHLEDKVSKYLSILVGGDAQPPDLATTPTERPRQPARQPTVCTKSLTIYRWY